MYQLKNEEYINTDFRVTLISSFFNAYLERVIEIYAHAKKSVTPVRSVGVQSIYQTMLSMFSLTWRH